MDQNRSQRYNQAPHTTQQQAQGYPQPTTYPQQPTSPPPTPISYQERPATPPPPSYTYPPGYPQAYPPYPQPPPPGDKSIYITFAGILLLIAAAGAGLLGTVVVFSEVGRSAYWIICGIMAAIGGIFALTRVNLKIAIVGAIFAIISIGLFASGIFLGVIALVLLILGKDSFNKA